VAVTAADIKSEFAEFSDLDDALIDPKIADAVQRVSSDTWGDLTDHGVKYLACHLIAISPLGEQAKLFTKTGETTYLQEYNAVKASLATQCRVT
jgi:hypothetical protein